MRYKKTIVYQRNKEFENVAFPKDWRVEKANPRYFSVPEENVKIVVTNNKSVKDAYRSKGVEIFDLNKETGELEREDEEVFDEVLEKEDSVEPVAPEKEDDEEPESVDTGFNLDQYLDSKNNDSEEVKESEGDNSEDQSKLPEDWRDLKWLEMRTLAKNYTEETVKNKEHAVEILEEVEKQQSKD